MHFLNYGVTPKYQLIFSKVDPKTVFKEFPAILIGVGSRLKRSPLINPANCGLRTRNFIDYAVSDESPTTSYSSRYNTSYELWATGYEPLGMWYKIHTRYKHRDTRYKIAPAPRQQYYCIVCCTSELHLTLIDLSCPGWCYCPGAVTIRWRRHDWSSCHITVVIATKQI